MGDEHHRFSLLCEHALQSADKKAELWKMHDRTEHLSPTITHTHTHAHICTYYSGVFKLLCILHHIRYVSACLCVLSACACTCVGVCACVCWWYVISGHRVPPAILPPSIGIRCAARCGPSFRGDIAEVHGNGGFRNSCRRSSFSKFGFDTLYCVEYDAFKEGNFK